MIESLRQSLAQMGRAAATLALPSSCVSCTGELGWRDRVASCCASCWNALERSSSVCSRCGLELFLSGKATCLNCQHVPPPADWIASWGPYRGTMERLLHAFKFARHDFLDDALSSLLIESYDARGDFDFDLVIAVPMHRRKLRQRGYNQAELLARAFARKATLEFQTAWLRKTRDNQSQSTLPRSERPGNVKGAFEADSRVDGRSLLLVDDICTTGATIEACCNALLARGAKRVAALTVARA